MASLIRKAVNGIPQNGLEKEVVLSSSSTHGKVKETFPTCIFVTVHILSCSTSNLGRQGEPPVRKALDPLAMGAALNACGTVQSINYLSIIITVSKRLGFPKNNVK